MAWWIPLAVGGASALYGMTRKAPEYEMSPEQREYYGYLNKILSGDMPAYSAQDKARIYQTQKEEMLPEYERIRKEQQSRFSRRNIEGGPVEAFEQRLGEHQITRLQKLRQAIEEESRRIDEARKMAALQGMGQIGSQISQANYQNAMQNYYQQQQALGNLAGTGFSLAYDMYGMNQPSGQGGVSMFGPQAQGYLAGQPRYPIYSPIGYTPPR